MRVERHVGPAGLHHTEHGDDELEGLVHVDPDERPGPTPSRMQPVREPVRALVQLRERQPVAVEHDGVGFGSRRSCSSNSSLTELVAGNAAGAS